MPKLFTFFLALVLAGCAGDFAVEESAEISAEKPILKTASQIAEVSNKKCGDGFCDEVEREKEICPRDCVEVKIEITPKSADPVRRAEAVAPIPQEVASTDAESSPFGAHPAGANNYEYAKDLGLSWNREGSYFSWIWSDPARSGNFSFKKAVAPENPNLSKSGGVINYDNQRSRLNLAGINTMVNVCPFHKGGEFRDAAEEQNYRQFVNKLVERYDGDDDLGCEQNYPDCYSPGDDEYPSAELIEKIAASPIKYWQVCNQLQDTCEDDCRDTFGEKFANAQKITYEAAKSADPTASILIAGDSGIQEYEPVFRALNGEFIDIVDFHRFAPVGDHDPAPDFDRLKRDLEKNNFDTEKLRFWITETGTFSDEPVDALRGRSFSSQSEKQQAGDLFKRNVAALFYGIEKIFWAWGIDEGFHRDCGLFDYTGLIYDGCDCVDEKYICGSDADDDPGAGVKKLGYFTFKLLVEKLDGADWDAVELVQNSDDIFIYKFVKNSAPIWVGWSDGDAERVATLEVGNRDSVKITAAIPTADSGAALDENNYPNFFASSVAASENGRVAIILGESPVFIETE